MDRQKPVVGEDEHDHLEEVAGVIRTDGELPGRVIVRPEVDDDDCVIRGMADGGVADAMTSSRTMDLHTPLV